MLIIQSLTRYFDGRAAKRRCPDCGRKADAKGKGKVKGNEEENLLGEEAEEGPSVYRDDEGGDSTTHV